MIEIRYSDGRKDRIYTGEPRDIRELCMCNIECLAKIALADTDKHIKALGGEEVLMELMERYEVLAQKMYAWEKIYEVDRTRTAMVMGDGSIGD